MITSELIELKRHLEQECGVPVDIGDRDLRADEYPAIKLIVDQEFLINYINEKVNSIVLPVTLKIICRDGQEQQAFETLDNVLMFANLFNNEKGHRLLPEGHQPEYIDENDTYTINVRYQLNIFTIDQ